MNTVLVDKKNIDEIVEFLRKDQVVAFPTETVFGLGVRYLSKEALQQIYDLKQREPLKAITLMVPNMQDIERYAKVDQSSEKIIKAFMPGPITLILEKQGDVDDEYTAGRDTIGIRIPGDPFVLEMLKNVGPMLVTSANMSGLPDMCSDQEVLHVFDKRIPLIVKGESGSGKASTVVQVLNNQIEILRKGGISLAEIEEVIK